MCCRMGGVGRDWRPIMLRKDLCIRCYNESRTLRWEKLPSKERMWAKGRLSCVKLLDETHTMILIPVYGPPPQSCPYILEHLVSDHS